MKITLVTNIFPPEIGGPATYASEILNRFDDRGHQVRVVTLSEDAKATGNVYVVHGNKLRIIGFIHIHLALLLNIMKVSKGCDVIYTLSPSFTGIVSLIAAKLLRKPIVLRFVGDAAWETASNTRQTDKNLEDFLQSPKGDRNVKLLRVIQKFVFQRVSKIIVPSEFLKELLVNYYKVNPEKITVIYNAVDLDNCKKPLVPPHQSRNKPVIITVGRLVRWKKIEEIIRAVSEIAEIYPEIRLLIVGEGPEETNLRRFSEMIGADSYVRFCGRVGHAEVTELFRGSNVFVLNSVYEGLPHVVIEAMACRTPVIATDIKGTNEVVEDGETGLLVSPNNTDQLRAKIMQLLKDEGLRERLVENAYRSVEEKFTWEKNLSMLEKELEEVILA